MPNWDIKGHDDLSKIPDIRMPESKLEDVGFMGDYSDRIRRDLKHRITRLRRMKLIKGDELTDLGREFVQHYLQHYTTFDGKLALCHGTDPDSYPEVEQERSAYGPIQPDYYWELLSEANEHLRYTVFEYDSWLTDVPKHISDALDENERFGSYYHRKNQMGQDVRHFQPNWNCYGGNGPGATDQYLVSDYDKDHFTDVTEFGDWAPEYLDQYESRAEAFADVYYELWALYLWSLHYTALTSPAELMYQWRWSLSGLYESRCEEIYELLHLGAPW